MTAAAAAAAASSAAVTAASSPASASSIQWVHALLVDGHEYMAFLFAVSFLAWRAYRRNHNGRGMTLDSALHQAAVGFTLPAFLMLCASYKWPDLVKLLSAHELGMAGLMATVTALRELFVTGDGSDTDVGSPKT